MPGDAEPDPATASKTEPVEWGTTTVSDPSMFAKFFLCSCGKYRLPDRLIEQPRAPRPMVFTRAFLQHATQVRTERNSHMLKHVSDLCRTPRLPPDVIAKCIPAKYARVSEMTCGGMSRIYAASADHMEHVVIKTTDCSRGLGIHEYACYDMLARCGLPIPKIKYVAMYGQILIMILSRHTLSLSSLLLALADRPASPLLDAVIHNVRHLLALLREARISYCDFSPDNIMVDVDPETLQGRFVIIDPQFALSMGFLTKKIGGSWARNVDRVHFAHKMQTLAMSEPRLRAIAARICEDFLGGIPSDAQTKRWILSVLPDGLRIAYDCIDRASRRRTEITSRKISSHGGGQHGHHHTPHQPENDQIAHAHHAHHAHHVGNVHHVGHVRHASPSQRGESRGKNPALRPS